MKPPPTQTTPKPERTREVVHIVAAAGGEFIGRMKLQRTAYFLELAGLGRGYKFPYTRRGPFSEELDMDIDSACVIYDIHEERKTHPQDSLIEYSVFTTNVGYQPYDEWGDAYKRLVSVAKDSNSVVIVLAAEAAFYGNEGEEDPWGRTEWRNEFMKDGDWFERARELYARFKELSLPRPLPDI